MDEAKAEGNPALIVDGGDMLFDRISYAPVEVEKAKGRAELIASLQKKIGVQAANVGDHDLALGLKYLEKLANRDFPLVSANLRDARNRPSKIPAYRIVEVGSLKIGVFGLLQSRVLSNPANQPERDFKVLDPIEVARAMAVVLHKKGVDLIVVLSNLGSTYNIKLANDVPGINFIIGSMDERLLNSPERVGDTLIFQTLNRGMYLGIAKVTMIPGDTHFMDVGERQTLKNRIEALNAQTRIFSGKVAELPEVRNILSDVTKNINEEKEKAKVLLKPSSRLENKILTLSPDVKSREDINAKILEFKTNNKL